MPLPSQKHVVASIKNEKQLKQSAFYCFIAGLQRLKRASEAPWVRKSGNPPSRESLVMTSPYERPSFVEALGEEREGRLNVKL